MMWSSYLSRPLCTMYKADYCFVNLSAFFRRSSGSIGITTNKLQMQYHLPVLALPFSGKICLTSLE